MGGLTFEKMLLIGIIAVFIFGPDRLPKLAEQLAHLIKRARGWVDSTKARVSEEMGDDFSEEDWRKLDPRQYDPRRIIRDAWNDADLAGGSTATASAAVGLAGTSGGAASGSATVAEAGTTATISPPGASSAPSWARPSTEANKLIPGRAPYDSEAT